MTRVLILGATSPIARALASEFADDGARVFLAARDEAESRRIADDLKIRSGVEARSGAFEATDFAAHERFIRSVVDEMGGLDGVVLCFGSLGDQESALHDSKAALRIVAENFDGAVSILTSVANHLEAQKSGFIIVIASVAGDRGRRSNYVYGAAKGALATFAQGLRARLGRSSVHVMTVKLGQVDTRMTYGRDRVMMVVSPDDAARRIYRAYKRRAESVYVPWFWRLIMTPIRMIPERIAKRLDF